MTYDPKRPIIFEDHWDIFRHFFEQSGSMTTPIATPPQVTPNPNGGTSIEGALDTFRFAMKGGAVYSDMVREMQEETGVKLQPIFINGVYVGDPIRSQSEPLIVITDSDWQESLADYVDFIRDGASL